MQSPLYYKRKLFHFCIYFKCFNVFVSILLQCPGKILFCYKIRVKLVKIFLGQNLEETTQFVRKGSLMKLALNDLRRKLRNAENVYFLLQYLIFSILQVNRKMRYVT